MLNMLPVRNCLHFMAPTSLDMWTACEVPGIVGVLRRDSDGQYTVIDAFGVECMPDANALLQDSRYAGWIEAAGGIEALRFDAFVMPATTAERRRNVVTLLQRSCGFRPVADPAYAHAV
jgi:hypothetical protein